MKLFHSFLAAVAATAACASAHAALGEGAATVETDRQQLRASVTRTSGPAFTVHELATGNGGVVREYVSAAGTVFAVTWHGPFLPNLRQVLGAHFDRVAQSTNRQEGGRGHLTVTEGNLVFVSTGHMRSFHGQAYLRDAIPSGVSTNDIQ